MSDNPVPLDLVVDLQDDLVGACTDLDRLQVLLADACETLMRGMIEAQEGLLAIDAPTDPGVREALAGICARIGRAAIALQFQDMSWQLIGHTQHRLRYCADRLAQATFADEDGVRLEPAPMRSNPVTQAEMDAGSVELF